MKHDVYVGLISTRKSLRDAAGPDLREVFLTVTATDGSSDDNALSSTTVVYITVMRHQRSDRQLVPAQQWYVTYLLINSSEMLSTVD